MPDIAAKAVISASTNVVVMLTSADPLKDTVPETTPASAIFLAVSSVVAVDALPVRAAVIVPAAKLPDQMLAFGISNQGNSQTLRKLFSTHPPIRERILALENTNFSENLNQQQI